MAEVQPGYNFALSNFPAPSTTITYHLAQNAQYFAKTFQTYHIFPLPVQYYCSNSCWFQMRLKDFCFHWQNTHWAYPAWLGLKWILFISIVRRSSRLWLAFRANASKQLRQLSKRGNEARFLERLLILRPLMAYWAPRREKRSSVLAKPSLREFPMKWKFSFYSWKWLKTILFQGTEEQRYTSFTVRIVHKESSVAAFKTAVRPNSRTLMRFSWPTGQQWFRPPWLQTAIQATLDQAIQATLDQGGLPGSTLGNAQSKD